MQDFPSNSAKARARSEGPRSAERSEKIERITSAEAERRKRGLGRQFKDTFIGGNARMAADYVLVDVVVPAIRDLMFDTMQGALDRYIYGETRRGVRRSLASSTTPNPTRVDYNSITRANPTMATRMLSRKARAQHNFDEIIIPSRVEAEQVLDQMFEILSRHEMVLVSELYEMTGIASSHTDHKWGWTALKGARVERLRDGRFVLALPEPQPLSA